MTPFTHAGNSEMPFQAGVISCCILGKILIYLWRNEQIPCRISFLPPIRKTMRSIEPITATMQDLLFILTKNGCGKCGGQSIAECEKQKAMICLPAL